MKYVITFLSLIILIGTSLGQKIKVSESSEKVNEIERTGQFVIIELDKKDVTKAWEKKLKEFGKVTSSKGTYTVNSTSISGVTTSASIIYSVVLSSGKGTKVWWAIDMGSSHVSSAANSGAYKGAEKILHDFAVQNYRDDIGDQIEDAEKAVSSSTKAHEKEIKQGQTLTKNVEDNKQEKINLEGKLKQNAADLEQLHKDIEANKGEQAAAAQDVEKKKKALEVVKEKLNHIE